MEDDGRKVRELVTDEIATEGGELPPGGDANPPALPEGALLELLTEDATVRGELSGSTVPESLMRLPILYAIQWLDAHRRGCRLRNNCPDTPGPLRFLLKVHNREAVVRAAPQIHKELWRRSETTMVRDVTEDVLAAHRDTADAVEDRSMFDPARLRATLRDRGDSGVQELAAVLWARGLDEPAEEELLRMLPVFLSPVEAEPVPVQDRPPEREPAEKLRHKKRREAAETKARELDSQVRELRSRGRSRAEELSRVTDELNAARAELESEHERAKDREARVEELTERTRLLDDAKRQLESDQRKASQANQQLRNELDRIRAERDDLDRERRDLTEELARSRSSRESLEAQLRLTPRGKDAVAAFLQDEEERIEELLHIAQGADRTRAEEEHRKRQKLERAFRDAYQEFIPPRPDVPGAVQSLRFTALGGGAEVGRSAYLVEIGTSRILVDCGLAVGRQEIEDMVPDVGGLTDIQAIVLTHAHTDHIGWLPALVARLDAPVPIYCTEATAAITPVMLDDARAHYERMLARRQLIAAHDPAATVPPEDYTRRDLYEVETRLHAVGFSEPRQVRGTEVDLTFYPAGHILGAGSVLLDGGGRRVLLSGDISSEFQATVPAAAPPTDLDSIDLLVLESTYGDRVREPAEDQRRALVEFVKRTTENGTAILPCFALGRGQEVLQILLQARKRGELDRAVSIWVDGLIRRINPIYADRHKLDLEGYQEIEGAADRALAIADCQRPGARAVVVTTSGMLAGGPVVEWAGALLGDARHRMALLGYQDEGAPGGALRQIRRQRRPPFPLRLPRDDGAEEVVLQVAGPVQDIGLSAHADQAGLLEYAAAVPARNIALVHGSPTAQEELAGRLEAASTATTVHRPGSTPLTIN